MTTATASSLNKRFNEENRAVYMCYKSLHISLPSSAKQQCEMTNSMLSEECDYGTLGARGFSCTVSGFRFPVMSLL